MKRALALLLLPAAALAADPPAPPGYDRQCAACHIRATGGDGSLLYTRDDRLVRDRDALLRRVAHCRQGSGLRPDPDAARRSADYLNRRYYRFP